MTPLKIAIAGANGRMGRVLVEAVNNHPDTVLSGALEHSGSEALGLDAGYAVGLKTGIAISDDVDAVLAQSDVLIDFTRPEPTLKHLQKCVEKQVNIIIGTTGFDDAGKAAIHTAAEQTGIVFAANFSVGVNLPFHILDTVARVLNEGYDIEIIEGPTATKSMPPAAPRYAWAKSSPARSAETSNNAPFTAAKATPVRAIRRPSALPPSAQATSSATTPPSSPPTASAWKSPTKPAAA
ncbi:dihydrodipicolinate reductase [Neisseria meningitidis]|nr:dihydrodipicolinate reductase [Neisseria meningitidis]